MATQAGHYAKELEQDVARATAVIQKLTSSGDTTKQLPPRGTQAMPRSELRQAAGLAFTFVRKAGVGLSFEHGHGFVIAKLVSDQVAEPAATAAGAAGGAQHEKAAPWTWSPPLFINVNAGSIGVTLGYSEIDSVVILDTEEAVHSFGKTVVEVDSDMTGAAGSVGAAHLPATAANLSNFSLSDKEYTYSITKGAMVDISLTGLWFTVDSRRNAAEYGKSVSPAAILEGGVRALAAMQALYGVLDSVMKGHPVEERAATGAGALAHPHRD